MNKKQAEREVHQIRNLNIAHPAVAEASIIVKMAYESVAIQRDIHNGEIPRYFKPTCGVISGPSGSGKTTFLQFVKSNLPPSKVQDDLFVKTLIPCVYVSVANMNTPKAVSERILNEFGQTIPKGASQSDMLRQIKNLFNQHQTNLILLDEIHEILPGTGIRQVMSWLKTLVNETRVSIFLAGIEHSEDIVKNNKELRARFMKRLQFRYMNFSMDSESSEFEKYLSKLLADIQKNLAFESVVQLGQQELKQLYLATEGNLNNISTLLIDASRAALLKGQKSLTMAHLSHAYENTCVDIQYDSETSPFDLKENELDKHIRLMGA